MTAFLRICGAVFVLLFFLIAAVLIVPGLLGIKNYYVVSGSMEPQIPVGSMIYVKDSDPLKLKEGDIVAFSVGNSVVTHRVTENDMVNGQLRTKGDQNPIEDAQTVPYRNVIGKYVIHLPYVGFAGAFFSTFYGRLLLVAVGMIGVLLLTYTSPKKA